MTNERGNVTVVLYQTGTSHAVMDVMQHLESALQYLRALLVEGEIDNAAYVDAVFIIAFAMQR